MFENSKYVTRGVNEAIGIEVQLLIWNMIDTMKVEKDYLQVFELKKLGDNKIKIIHRQEVPEYRSEYMIKGVIEIGLKIFAIDSGEYSILLKSSEY